MPSTAMLQTKVGTFLKAARSAWMLSGICCAAITSIEIANANAASMKVSSRVISIPRKRNPPNRGNESRSAGTADAISAWRPFICRDPMRGSAPFVRIFLCGFSYSRGRGVLACHAVVLTKAHHVVCSRRYRSSCMGRLVGEDGNQCRRFVSDAKLRVLICSAIFFSDENVDERESENQRGSFGPDILCCQRSSSQTHR